MTPGSTAQAGRASPVRRRVPLHRSLLVRLLATSVLIACCAVAATAWLAARTATSAVRQQQGQALADDARIYDALLAYAASHRDWHGADATVRSLARTTGRQITLVDRDGDTMLAASAPDAPLPERPWTVVDPLRVPLALAPAGGGSAERIDARAVGPYALTQAERRTLDDGADRVAVCLRGTGLRPRLTRAPSGRPVFHVDAEERGKVSYACALEKLEQPLDRERIALEQLNRLIARCTKRQGEEPVRVGLGFTAPEASPAGQACIDSARRQQLRPYVAPPATLYLGAPADGGGAIGLDLSPANTTRIVIAAALVLLLTVSITVLVGARLVRPLRALTDAALSEDTGRVRINTRDEIGQLAAAFNDLGERRERLEEQRKALVSDVAHELRNPLSNMRVWLEAAQDGVAELDQALTASLLEEAVQLQHLVDDLRDLAAADAGTLRLHPEPLALRDVLEQVAAGQQAAARTGRITLTVSVTGDPVLNADPVRLRQIVTNLLSNALRHTPVGGTVTLNATDGDDEVLIQVADTGTGIAPDDLDRVFDRFWRADRSRSRRTGGSGLGLAIVRQLTRAHGGTVTAHSVLGEGTVFTLRLPATAVEHV